MADAKVEITNSDPKFIARELRKMADGFDPWPPVRSALCAFFFGVVLIASMDYGDLWICVGQCNAMMEN